MSSHHPHSSGFDLAALDALLKIRSSATNDSVPFLSRPPANGAILPSASFSPHLHAQVMALQAANLRSSIPASFGVPPPSSVNTSVSSATPPVQEKEKDKDSPDKPKIPPVRKEKIEAALRSKPQRGRKRENLSAVERLELTRTRNREHAKTTRMRKKARHQELVDAEAKLKHIESLERLDADRREALVNFLMIRQTHLRQYHPDKRETPQEQATGETARVGPNGPEEGLVYSLSGIVSVESSDQDATVSGFELMNRWDRAIASSVVSCCGARGNQLLSYYVDVDEISVSKKNSAMACFEIRFNDATSVLKGVIKVGFTPGSSRMVHVEWITSEDRIQEVLGSPSNALRCGFPSVVSLDLRTGQEELKTAEGDGVGMNI